MTNSRFDVYAIIIFGYSVMKLELFSKLLLQSNRIKVETMVERSGAEGTYQLSSPPDTRDISI